MVEITNSRNPYLLSDQSDEDEEISTATDYNEEEKESNNNIEDKDFGEDGSTKDDESL